MNKEKLLSIGLLLLRVSVGLMMLLGHGIAKLKGFSQMVDNFPDPGMGSQLSLISAIGAEVGCSLLLILGVGTRFACIPLAFTMIVALFIVHADDPWKVKELAAAYLAIYATLALTGGGHFSLDDVIRRRRAPSRSTEIS